MDIRYRRSRHKRWRAIAAAMAAAVTIGLANPAFADTTSVTVNATELHERLFAGRVRAHATEPVRDLVLSAELLGWRERHPAATAAELANHTAALAGVLAAQAGGNTQEPDQLLVRMLEVVADQGGSAAIASPMMLRVVQGVTGSDSLPIGTVQQFIQGGRGTFAQYDRTFVLQDLVWGQVATRSAQDPALAQAWNTRLGTPLGIDALESDAQILADPAVGGVLDVPALLSKTGDRDAFIAEARSQFIAALSPLDVNTTRQDNAATKQAIAALGSINASAPADSGAPRADAGARTLAQTQAAERQKIIDGAGTAVGVLSSMMAKADEGYARTFAAVGKATVQIATAINKFVPAIAGLGFTQALFSMSTAALTGNVIGAIATLLPLFGGGGQPQQAMLDEMQKIKASIDRLASTMNARFDRIDKKLDLLFAQTSQRLDEIIRLQNATLAKLQELDRALSDLSGKLDQWGAELVEISRQQGLQPVNGAIDGSLNWAPLHGGAAMTLADYDAGENPLHLFATDTAQWSPFVGPSNPDTDILTVLNTWNYQPGAHVNNSVGANGAVLYLHDYAARRYGWSWPQLSGKTPADSASWAVASRAYMHLQAQNPQVARIKPPARAASLAAEGDEILAATSAFSTPAGGHTNALFTGMTNEYADLAGQFSDRLTALQAPYRADLVTGVDIFGSIDQVPADQVPADPATLPACSGNATALSRPANTSLATAPKEIFFADWASTLVRTSMCQSVGLSDVETFDDGKWITTTANMRATVQVRMDWNGTLIPVRTWEQTWPLGVVCRQLQTGAPGGTCHNEAYYRNQWSTVYKPSFESSAVYTGNEEAARNHVRSWFYGRAADYYAVAGQELRTPGTTLFTVNNGLTRTVRVLRAYTALGFGRALEQDDLLPLLLTGAERLPSDQSGDSMIAATVQRGRDVYCPGNVCIFTGPYNPMAGQPFLDTAHCTVPAGGTAHRSADPVGNCLLGNQLYRIKALQDRYEAHSAELAAGTYTEGMPEIVTQVALLRIVDAAIRA